MIKLTVLYGQPTDPVAFDTYYRETHIPLAHKLPGMQRIEVAKVQSDATGVPAPYYLIAELYFESMEQYQATMGGSEGRALAGDVPNFATGTVSMLISEIW